MAARSDADRDRSAAARPGRFDAGRTLLAWLLLLLFCLTAPPALVAVWGRLTVGSADAYAAAVRPVAADDRVQTALLAAVNSLGPAPTVAPPTAPGFVSPTVPTASPPAPVAPSPRPTAPRGVGNATPTAAATARPGRPVGAPPTPAALQWAASAAQLPTPTPSPQTSDAGPPPTLPAASPPAGPTAPTAPAPTPTVRVVQRTLSPTASVATSTAAAAPGAGIAAPTSPAELDDAVRRYLDSAAFADAWAAANRAAYEQLRAGGPLVLDLSPAAAEFAAAAGLPAAVAATDAFRLSLLDADAAARLRTALNRLAWLSVLLPAVAVAALIGALWAGPDKLRWLRRLGFGLAVSMIVLLLVLLVGVAVAGGRVGGAAGGIVAALLDALIWWPVLLAAGAGAIGLAVALLATVVALLARGRRPAA